MLYGITLRKCCLTSNYALKASKAAAEVKNDDFRSREIKGQATMAYLKSKNKASLLYF